MPDIIYLPKGSKSPNEDNCIVINVKSRGSENVSIKNGRLEISITAPFLEECLNDYKSRPVKKIYVIGKPS